MDGDAGDVDDFGDALLASRLETDTDDRLERGRYLCFLGELHDGLLGCIGGSALLGGGG